MRKMIFFMVVLTMLSGCTAQQGLSRGEKPAEERAESLLTEAPAFVLTDVASGAEPLEIGPSAYSWGYEDGSQTGSVIACGVSPQDAARSGLISKLKIPEGTSLYSFSTQIPPDILRIHQWDGTGTGMEGDVSIYHDEMPLLKLQAGKLYSFELEWKEEDFAKNKFYGTADYFLETE